MIETTALGASIAAALGSESMTVEDIKKKFSSGKRIETSINEEARNKLYAGWKKAVERSLNWVE